ncbi:MAG: ribosome biogenesis GTPase Der [Candidatus Omnitrophica bacterium]|nr:ribosome biogenesis GTPase Der [Candidatus Omnitrophota bacterium]
MKKLFTVAMVGRPNVGKSALFNRLVGRRQAIVESTIGVTRDRVYAEVSWGKTRFLLIDTGGFIVRPESSLHKAVVEQAKKAIEETSLLLLIVDAKDGLIGIDYEVADYLRKFNKKIMLVVNKVDNMALIDNYSEFYKLGFKNTKFVSSLHGLNIDSLLDGIEEEIDDASSYGCSTTDEEDILKIAIVGRPNVGKSSFFNRLLKEERVIVDHAPGTTRDSVDTLLMAGGQKFMIIDTAGIRQIKKPHGSLDIYSRSRTIEAIKRADVCIVIIEAQKGICRDDLHIFDLVKEEEKCCIIAVNKIDLFNVSLNDCINTFTRKAPFMNYAFIVLCSAKKGKNVEFALNLVKHAWGNYQRKIKQNKLGQTLGKINEHMRTFPGLGAFKINYLTQIKKAPPAFVLIVNRPELVKDSVLRYVENKIREQYNFKGAPIKIQIQKKQVK